MKKIQLYKILFLICFWGCCTIFVVFYDAAVLGFKSEIEGGNYSFSLALIVSVIITIIGATLLGTIEVLYLNKLLRKKPFGITLLLKTAVYLMFIIVFVSMVKIYMYSSEIDKPLQSGAWLNHYVEFLSSPRVIMTILYWGFACILALFVLQVNDKFGQGVLINFLLGKYHWPKVENRIFMFMDLNASTTYAEKLGHIKYSQLIQDCFFDITDIVNKYEAKIYQYIGDEVVLSWETQDGIKRSNCVNTFFAYDSLLKSKSDYYKNKYGIIPLFKAGLNSGNVTVAEVGELKKELAYHGDVLNTAARIQSKCNEYQSRILISEQIKNYLEKNSHHKFNFLGNVLLKGKENSVNIYEVHASNNMLN